MWPGWLKMKNPVFSYEKTGFSESGAGNEIRTRDPNLGKVVLYQLSYSRLINGGVFYGFILPRQLFLSTGFSVFCWASQNQPNNLLDRFCKHRIIHFFAIKQAVVAHPQRDIHQ